MKTFLIVTTAFSLSFGDNYDYLEVPYDEAITMNCPDECPLLYQPICAGGSNYANQCELDCENRQRREMYLPDLYPSCHRTCSQCHSAKKRNTKRPRHRLVEHYKRLHKKTQIHLF
ncbi:hypothetical protein MSG28_003178 [Choristoneura fumiferana]|uniref:Uncharacterized protein n=1 Tax=Choristoneura fumiferana TaxID=7141 RepID=A0ACC0KEK0_CHOFU|nr:hypothetical protein MSG28_003178 [Choristoneura fumiferana]